MKGFNKNGDQEAKSPSSGKDYLADLKDEHDELFAECVCPTKQG